MLIQKSVTAVTDFLVIGLFICMGRVRVLLNLYGWERKMLIRDTVTAQERLSGLQPKCIRNRLFDKREMVTRKKGIKNILKIRNYLLEII